jgi:hypothetical protein
MRWRYYGQRFPLRRFFKMKRFSSTISAIATFCFLPTLAIIDRSALGASVPSFNRDVRPILSDKCFSCHGNDRAKRKGDLRLDTAADAVRDRIIVPGKPDESEVMKRILTHDDEETMPPPKSKLGRLSASEVEIIRAWIAGGAVYEKHWAFIPVNRAMFHGVKLGEVVAKRRQQKGLKGAPRADADTLLRRASYDLTGLPPTRGELAAFRADASPEAFARAVDGLLAKPQFAERMASDWMDYSRYADSYGFQVDRDREVWPWRDWVISAFERNMPFDQFVTWQLAGDLLPGASEEQVLATAFNRLHQQEAEGGSVEEEYRMEYVADRVQTFASMFLGLTFECARCHDHKYDPVTQREYYQMAAFFDQIDEAGLYSFFTSSAPTPAMPMTTEASRSKQHELEEAVAKAEGVLANERERAARRVAALIKTDVVPPQPGDGALISLNFDSAEKGVLVNGADAGKPSKLVGENVLVDGFRGKAVRFSGDDALGTSVGNFTRSEPFSVSLRLLVPDRKDRAVVFSRSKAWTDAASRGYELLIEDGRLKWSLIHFWPGDAISVRTKSEVPLDQWMHVVVSYDGSSCASGLRMWINGELAKVEVVRDRLTREITGGGSDSIVLGERMRDRGFRQGVVDDFRVFSRELSALEVLAERDDTAPSAWMKSALSGESPAVEMVREWLISRDAEVVRAQAALVAARGGLAKQRDGLREIMVMRDLPGGKKTFVRERGEYDKPREEVVAGTPAVLGTLPKGVRADRSGLAAWLTDPKHPLFARVTVNRLWQSFFGRGLVRTAEDFGSQGERPVHGDALDLLAAHFMESGWDLKALVREIVLSDVYCQVSGGLETAISEDPENEWLARGPRFRLSAEAIRDGALHQAGLLSLRVGGPSVNPYELTEAFRPSAVDKGEGAYRRSLYTRWRRTAPPPAMLAFDAPRRASCQVKRERTNTPLQALILLNGPQFVEAARVLGERLLEETGGDVERMVTEGFRACLGRDARGVESGICARIFAEQRAYYEEHPAEAKKLLGVGQAVRLSKAGEVDVAAAAVLMQALMTHDAAVVKY